MSRRLNLNATENRSGNLEWSIKRYRQYWAHKTQDEDNQNKITRHRKPKRSATRTLSKSPVLNQSTREW